MSETIYHGRAVNRGRPGTGDPPLTGELSGTARDIVRLLEGTDGQALMTEISAQLATVPRAQIEDAVRQLADAGIVTAGPGFGEPVVRLRHPFTEAIESIPKKD